MKARGHLGRAGPCYVGEGGNREEVTAWGCIRDAREPTVKERGLKGSHDEE